MFRADGTWIPDQSFQSNSNASANTIQNDLKNQNNRPMADLGSPQVAQQGTHLQMMPQANFQNQSFGFNPNGQDPRIMFMQAGITPQNSPPAQPIQSQSPLITQNQGGILSQGGGGSPPQNFSFQNFAPTQSSPFNSGSTFSNSGSTPLNPGMANMPTATSPMQSINHADPQAVQNYLQSLSRNGASSNAWQNPQGVQGQSAQAGFKGFNNAPPPSYSPNNFSTYSQPQLGSMQNPNIQTPNNASISSQISPSAPGSSVAPSSKPTYFQPVNKTFGLAASDIEAKQNIQPVANELEDFLNSLNAYSYEYKDPKYGDGRRISPMAQEIEQTPLGKAAISTNQEGYKIVDYGKLGGTMLAGLSLLNHKYNDLEKQLKESILTGLKNKKQFSESEKIK